MGDIELKQSMWTKLSSAFRSRCEPRGMYGGPTWIWASLHPAKRYPGGVTHFGVPLTGFDQPDAPRIRSPGDLIDRCERSAHRLGRIQFNGTPRCSNGLRVALLLVGQIQVGQPTSPLARTDSEGRQSLVHINWSRCHSRASACGCWDQELARSRTHAWPPQAASIFQYR